MTKVAEKFIIALDVPTKARALDLVRQLGHEISFFKVGLQLYTSEGPEVVRAVLATGAKVLLDLKFHDIPNTVAKAVESAADLGVQMLTIHLSGGSEMIRAAIAGRKNHVSILGVTVLTSGDEVALGEAGISAKVGEQVLRLARLGAASGIDGIVASPREIKMLRAEFGDEIKIVAPGIRPAWSQIGDQRRFTTPQQAIEAGADYLVIGRPITLHPNPCEAVELILSDLR